MRTLADRALDARLLAALALAVVSCSGAPKPPPCADCAPWTPAPIPRPPASAAAPAPTQAAPPPVAVYSIEQLLKVRRSTAPRAVDEQSFFYLYDAPGTAQLYRAGKQGEAPKQLTAYPDRVSSFRLAPDGKTLVFLKDLGGDENDQLHRLDLAGGEPIALTSSPKVKHTLPCFDSAGKRVAFTSNARNGKDMDLYVAPWGAPKPAPIKGPLVELSGSFTVTDFQGDRVVAIEARSNVDQDVWIIDAKSKAKKLLTKHAGDERYEGARLSRDGKAVYVLTDGAGAGAREFMALVAIDVASGKRTDVLVEEHDLGSLALPRWSGPAKKGDPEDLAMVSVNVDGLEHLAVLSLDKARKVSGRTDPKVSGVIGTIDVASSGKVAYVSLDASTRPMEVYRVDVATGEAQRVTRSDHAGVDEGKLVDATIEKYTTFDGRKISYFWWAPAGAEKLPVVIELHGGPEAQAQPWFSAVRQYLALSGYAVAAPNIRGSLGYGKSFAHLDDKEKREDSVRDLAELGKALARRPEVDPKRIALYGGSYGGYMVLAGMTLYPEMWAAGVDVVGIANFKTFLEQTAPYRRALREAEYGSLEKDSPLLEKISPIHKVDRIQAPLMVIHGTNDPRVPIGEAKQIAAALEKRGVPVQLKVFDDEGHGLSKLKNRLVAYPAMVKFLDQYLRGPR
ncbi:MAG: S9 family peptidase [Deltaproteobacteria bacterium]|nr:S9 family peptidase [Deltaproteobacteria bacterium]